MKKKTILVTLILISIVVLVLTIYRSGTMVCTFNNKNDVYSINTIYSITFKKRIVTSILTEEIIQSNDEKMLEEYKISLDLLYSKYKKLKYYDNKTSIKNNQLVSITKINYQKINKNEFIKLDRNNRRLFTGNVIKLKTLQKIYKENGAKCTYKSSILHWKMKYLFS